MTDLNDKAKRLELVRRYLDADTTVEEEHQLLDYYTREADELEQGEEAIKLVLTSTAHPTKEMSLSAAKEAEFDQLMKAEPIGKKPHSLLPPLKMLLPASLVAAAVLVFMLSVHKANDEQQKPTLAQSMEKPTHNHQDIADKTQLEKTDETFIATLEKDKVTPRKTTPQTEEREKEETNTSEKEKVTPEESVSETFEAAPTRTMKTTADSERSQPPMNVATANYDVQQIDNYSFIPTDNVTIVTYFISDGNTGQRVVMTSDHGMKMIYTEEQEEAVIYKIDGQRVSKETVNQLKPDSIMELRVLKRGSAAAILEGPDGHINDIILITTKKSNGHSQDHSSSPFRQHP